MTASSAIGIDLGGTNIKAAIVDQNGQVLIVRSRPTPGDRSVDSVINDIVQLVTALVDQCSIDQSDVRGAGIGTPGPIDVTEGRIVRSVNFPAFQNVPLRDILQEKLNVPVFLDNDGNVAAYGEYWAGTGMNKDEADPIDSLVMLTLGTGVGAGVIINGRIFHGHFDNAGELGHMIVVRNGLPCPCGQRGCLEQYASAAAVAQRVMTAIQEGESCILEKSVVAGESIDAKQVSGAARDGDPLCLRMWEDACQYLAIACINIQHTYNPARIVLGGGMSEAGSFLLDRVIQHIQQQRWSMHDDLPEITLAKLGNDAGIIGAAGLVWMRMRELSEDHN